MDDLVPALGVSIWENPVLRVHADRYSRYSLDIQKEHTLAWNGSKIHDNPTENDKDAGALTR